MLPLPVSYCLKPLKSWVFYSKLLLLLLFCLRGQRICIIRSVFALIGVVLVISQVCCHYPSIEIPTISGSNLRGCYYVMVFV